MHLILRATTALLITGATASVAYAQTTDITQQLLQAQQILNSSAQDDGDGAFITHSTLDMSAAAKQIRTGAIQGYLSVVTNPPNPEPYQTTTITIDSYLTDLNKALISWSVNGVRVLEGVGERKVTFKNGGPGVRTLVALSVVTNDNESFTQTFAYTPVGITLHWEADTYTPPFYRGKALMTPQSSVRVVVMPDTAGTTGALDPNKLSYVWKVNGTPVGQSSGYAKNAISLKAPKPYDSMDVSAQVSNNDNSVASEKKISLPLGNPFVMFYESHPLLGPWYNRPLPEDIDLSRREVSIIAVPFFFSLDEDVEGGGNFTTAWLVNGKQSQTVGRLITLRNETGEEGSSNISYNIQGDLGNTFQYGKQSLRLNFTSTNPSSGFF